ncbi:FAD:protein FMN transferase [Thalassotalea mangrovi]|uniref:FAD:protein FMN transferase n=1 Tax=Thalassotalea mangrovi TaxID=2572245 RepID=A0A4U1B459_9GAMM|nr:FAD:protein FMN transferase [Thalassotalea mangrovi]TKB45060.1 FAD:protein FMN transferase [Thalassotalea mangrovi]
MSVREGIHLRFFKYPILLLLTTTFLLACTEPQQKTVDDTSRLQELQITGYTMGPIVYTVKLIANKQQVEESNLAADVDELLVSLNKKMSTWDKASELSLINQGSAGKTYTISDELLVVLNESVRLAQLTQGSLDVTVGPLVNLWSFGPENRPETIPSEQEIAAAMDKTGINKLNLQGNVLRKQQDELYVDLSAIAKGYAVDKVAELLEQKGYHDYLVDIGGEMRIKGNKIDNKSWRIAVEKPISGTRAVQKVIIPGDNAVATSGDYRNYFEVDGVRYSHTIDPASGWPINHKLVSVTVVHPSAMTADGLATAIEVMGPEKGFTFAQQHRLAVYLISKTEQGFQEQSTDAFEQLIAE